MAGCHGNRTHPVALDFSCPGLPWPLDSMRDAVFTVSPKRQYRGIFRPTTPAHTGPAGTEALGDAAGQADGWASTPQLASMGAHRCVCQCAGGAGRWDGDGS